MTVFHSLKTFHGNYDSKESELQLWRPSWVAALMNCLIFVSRQHIFSVGTIHGFGLSF